MILTFYSITIQLSLNGTQGGILPPCGTPLTVFPVAMLPGGKTARNDFLTEIPVRPAEPVDTITVGGVPPTPPLTARLVT